MRRLALAGLVLSLGLVGACGDNVEGRAEESRSAVKEFAAGLQTELKSALKEGGPVRAISVCNVKAGEIAGEVSERRGWRIGRTSLKVRNPDNEPDDWERGVLEEFERRLAGGEPVEALERAEVVAQGDRRLFRYMKAISTKPLCLTCHGSDIDPAVEARLGELYPSDRARGFEVGDIRGAFTVTQPLQGAARR